MHIDKKLHSEEWRGMAVLYPLLPRGLTAAFVACAAAAVVALALWLPAELHSCSSLCDLLNVAHSIALRVPEIGHLSSESAFPLATSVSYVFALLLGVLGAVCLALTRFAKLNYEAVRAGGIGTKLVRVGAYALWLAQFVVAAPAMNKQQFSHEFFEAVASDRTFLLAWTLGMYVLSLAVVLGMVIDLTHGIIKRWFK